MSKGTDNLIAILVVGVHTMFNLEKAFANTYNPKTGLYARKDALVDLVPVQFTELRAKITKLVKKYPAKLVVKIVTAGYPECPCCGRPITSPNRSGSKRDEFTKTCGRKPCLSWYLRQGSDHGKALSAKAKEEIYENLQPYFRVIEDGTFYAKVKCTKCGSVRKRTSINASAHCNCSKGEAIVSRRSSNRAQEKAERVAALESSLPSSLKLVKVHEPAFKVDLRCNLCGKTQTKWLCVATGWKCGCKRDQSLADHWDSMKQATLSRVKQHFKGLGLKYAGTTSDGRYRAICKCGLTFVPNQPLLLKVGCRSCATKAATPARVAQSVKTCLKRYGVSHVSQHKPIHDRQVNSGYRAKPYRLGRRVVNVRGYEPQALDYLLALGIPVGCIRAGGKGIPSIRYKYQGKDRVYFPDILLTAPGKRDTLVEVKSTYTFKVDPKLKAKQKAVEKAGYAFRLLVMTEDGRRLSPKELKQCKRL